MTDTPETAPVEVTQADEAITAELEWELSDPLTPEDKLTVERYFARHRLAHRTTPDAARQDVREPVTFDQAWAEKEAQGYRYGGDALENVRFGWDIAVAALSTSPLANETGALREADYAEAFDILVDLQEALVLTADHSPGAAVGSFVASSTQYDRLNRFLHARQDTDPRAALSPDDGEGK